MEKTAARRIKFTCVPEDIVYVNGVFDSYGGLGLVRTLDVKEYNCAVYSTDTVLQTALDVFGALVKEGVGIKDIRVEETEEID